MRHFPAFHDLQGRLCLIVGGGEAAARKARLLRKAGARLRVVAANLHSEFHEDEVAVTEHRARGFRPADLEGAVLAFAATGEAAADAAVSAAARAAGVPINVVDRQDLSSFLTPAIVERDPLVIAIGSGGAAPLLARRVRERIERLLPTGLGRLALFAESLRARVAEALPAAPERLRFWEGFFDGPLAEAVLRGEEPAARQAVARQLAEGAPPPRGAVALVGTGPGDPDLLTLRALRLLQSADALVYDRSVTPAILDRGRRDAERHPLGAVRDGHDLLLRLAGEGKRVVWLEPGDPSLYGRAGQALAWLQAGGVPVQLVPGVAARPLPEQHVILSAAKDLVPIGAQRDRDPSLPLRITIEQEYAR